MPEPRWLDETQAIAWRSLLIVMQRAMPEIERTLRSYDLIVVHYHIFVSLSEAPDMTMRLSDLADSANLSQSRLTHRMRTLVEREYVEVCQDPKDRRAKNATLTPTGIHLLESIAPKHAEDVQRLMFDHLNQEQTEALADALSAIAISLCQHPEYLNPPSLDERNA